MPPAWNIPRINPHHTLNIDRLFNLRIPQRLPGLCAIRLHALGNSAMAFKPLMGAENLPAFEGLQVHLR